MQLAYQGPSNGKLSSTRIWAPSGRLHVSPYGQWFVNVSDAGYVFHSGQVTFGRREGFSLDRSGPFHLRAKEHYGWSIYENPVWYTCDDGKSYVNVKHNLRDNFFSLGKEVEAIETLPMGCQEFQSATNDTMRIQKDEKDGWQLVQDLSGS